MKKLFLFLLSLFLCSISAPILAQDAEQALLRQGFGIPSGNVRVYSEDFYGRRG